MPPASKTIRLIYFINRLNERIGCYASWLTLLLVLLTFLVVVMRYVFNIGAIAVQESLLYLHSLIFLLGASYTLKHNGHVRVDIFYRPMSAVRKAWVNLLGILLLLLPVCIFIFLISWQYVSSSWSYYEGSREAGGLDAVYLLKSLLLIMPVFVSLQGLAEILHSILIIRGLVESEQEEEGVSL